HRRAPRSTRFPYTTLFRSVRAVGSANEDAATSAGSVAAARPVGGEGRAVHAREAGLLGAAEARVHLLDQRAGVPLGLGLGQHQADRKSTRLNSSHVKISYA